MEEKKQLKEISQSGKKENVSLKEKYDILVNKLYYASLVLTAIGIFYLGKGIGEFRERVISLNPEYEFSKFSDFKICIVLITLISIFKYCIQRALIKFCQKIMKNSFKHPKNENDKILAKKYITRFFDFKAFARELFMSDYDMGDGGHVFRTC